jgi:putative tryptophan/tyrosine transport system substrate-binding protein
LADCSGSATGHLLCTVAWLGATAPDVNAEYLRTFREALKGNGFVEGENVTIVYRWADGKIDRMPELASELVRRQVAVLVTAGDAGALAAKAATTVISIRAPIR